MDAWPIITGENEKTPHDKIILGYDYSERYPNQGALIVGNYKLIVGQQGNIAWINLDNPCSKSLRGPDCNPYCLYDIVNDPSERRLK